MIDHLTKDQGPSTNKDGKTYTYKTLARACVGNHLWVVFNLQVETPNVGTEDKKFIALFLMQRQGGDWGYKDMEESMHPFYYTCPKSFLDMAPVKCQEWRDKVNAYHAKRGVKLAVGDRVKLNEGCKPNELRIISVKPLLGVTDTGARFRIPRKMIAGKVSETVQA
jgi:hypothetical protein